MKDTYTLGQIMFALREEYIRVQAELDELSKEFIIPNDKLVDYGFFLAPYGRMVFYLEERKNLLDRVMSKLGMYVAPVNYQSTYDLAKEIKNEYKTPSGVGIATIERKEELQQEVRRILDMDYTKNIVEYCNSSLLRKRVFPDNSNSKYLLIRGYEMFYGENYYPTFCYMRKDDEFLMNHERRIGKILSEDIYSILGVEFNRNKFNEYCQNVIDNYQEKDVEIIGNFNSNKIRMKLEEEPKKLILTVNKRY